MDKTLLSQCLVLSKLKNIVMKNLSFFIFVNILLCSSFLFANNTSDLTSNGDYAVSNIPVELKKNANAVIRIDNHLFELHSPGTATYIRKYAITILNDKADRYSHFVEGYDKQRKIKNIKGNIYNENGALIRRIKKKEIIDQTAVSGGSLYEDSRIKAIEIIHNVYPYTVEIEFEVKYSGLLIYPSWFPVKNYKIAVENSTYKILIPHDMDFQYRLQNYDAKPIESTSGNNKTYEWTMKNYSALKNEPFSPDAINVLPKLIFSPNKFEYDGHRGNMESWESYGRWMNYLLEGRDVLEEETVQKINQLVNGVESKEEKVRIIYEHLQSKTRYISIQLGIGGLQPFEAKEVDKNGYGDCKALSNYTRAMLKAVGINSYYATIGAGPGHKSIDPSFTFKGYTNHVILCVPIESDTIWLECTSQNQPFGFLGRFTDDRNALLITEDGGKIVRTTRYDQSVNTQLRNATVKIDKTGNAQLNVTTKYKGLQYENVEYQFQRNEKEQKESLYERLDISNMEIEKFNYSQDKNRIPEATEELDLKIKNYASVSGKRVFIPLNILNKTKRIPPKVKDRKTDIVMGYAYIDTDEITYEVPGYFKIEHLPESVDFESDFGSYSASVTKKENKITYVRTIKMNKGTYPPERYDELLDFYKKMVRADKMKLVILEEIRP